MKFWIGMTDNKWFEFLSARSPDEVNFWRPSGVGSFKAVERFHPKRILLFGSHARGDASPDSDLDLFIEMDTQRRPPDRAIEVSEILGLRPWPMDKP
jgi:hypothetical protein